MKNKNIKEKPCNRKTKTRNRKGKILVPAFLINTSMVKPKQFGEAEPRKTLGKSNLSKHIYLLVCSKRNIVIEVHQTDSKGSCQEKDTFLNQKPLNNDSVFYTSFKIVSTCSSLQAVLDKEGRDVIALNASIDK